MKLFTSIIRLNLIFAIVALLAACGGGGGGGATATSTEPCQVFNSSDPDTDGDGLPDCFEITKGTSPADVDSDGDGLTDFDEVVTKAFDPSINNFQFNPRIADVPDISVQLQSLPDFSINFTDSTTGSQTRSLTEGTRTSTTLTNSYTYEQSVGEEVSGTIGSQATFPGFGISSSVTYTKNQQETMSWTTTQSQENESFRETTESETSTQGVANTSGDINILIKVQNRGYQTVTLSNMTLTALQVSPLDPTRQKLVSGMDYDTSGGVFPTFDIVPNGESNSLPFRATLSLGKAYDLLRDSRNLIIEPTTWNITDQDGRSYTHNLTNVGTRAAKVVIDYAGVANRENENYYVATVTDFGVNRITAATAVADILNVQYTEGSSSATFTGTNSGLLSVRNVANDDSVNGRWILIHNHLDTDGITRVKETYDITQGTYSLDNIRLAKGETLHLMYIEDKDGDGIASREEFLHGTSDTNMDTDGDGLTDFEEIKGGWEIPVTQSIMRTVYSNPTLKDADNDALEDGAERTKGTDPGARDTDNDGVLDSSDSTLTLADMQETAFLPLSQSMVIDTSINANTATTGAFSFMTDRFGNANAAAAITDDPADQMDVSDVFDTEPLNGASLVMWVKVDANLPATGWSLYEHAGSPGAISSNAADQFFWIYPIGFTVFGDGGDRHSVFANKNSLFTTLAFADWHMLAMVAEEETVGGGMLRFTVYFDGQLYNSVTHPTTLARFYTAPWKFAGPTSYNVGIISEYRGGIDDIRFFKRALDSEEVQLLYNATQ